MRTQLTSLLFIFLLPYFINAQESNSIQISESLIVQLETIPEEQRLFQLPLNGLTATYGTTYLDRYFSLMSDFKIRFQPNPTEAQVLVILGEYWFEEATELTAINQYLLARSNRVKSFLDQKVKPGDNTSSLVNLETQSNNDATALVTQLVGDGITFANAELDCPASAAGTFNGTGTNLNLSSGILLTSGDINLAPGPNNLSDATEAHNAPGDALLGQLINGVEGVDTFFSFVENQLLKYDTAAVINVDTNAFGGFTQLLITLSDSTTFTIETNSDYASIDFPNFVYVNGNFSELILSDTTILPLEISCTPENCDTIGLAVEGIIYYDTTDVQNIDTITADEFTLNYKIVLSDSTIINYSEDLFSNFTSIEITLPNLEFPVYENSFNLVASDTTIIPLEIFCIPEECDTIGLAFEETIYYDTTDVQNIDTITADEFFINYIVVLSDSTIINYSEDFLANFSTTEVTLPNYEFPFFDNSSSLMASDTTIIPFELSCTPEQCSTPGLIRGVIYYDTVDVQNIDTVTADGFTLNYEIVLLDSTIINYSEDLPSHLTTIEVTLPNEEYPFYENSFDLIASDTTIIPLDISCIPEDCDTIGIINEQALILDTTSWQIVDTIPLANGYQYTIVSPDSTIITYSEDTTIHTTITLPDNQTFYGSVSMVMEGAETILPLDETYTVLGQTLCDACILEFDFTSDSSQLYFNFVFASEEYMEYFCSAFNDVFGFFISGPNPDGGAYVDQNIAFVSGTDIPVAINNVGNGTCNDINNSTRYADNSGGSTVQYDGFTTVFTVQANILPDTNYHFKIGIMDVGDCILDSGVFLEQGTFSSSSSAPEINLPNDICEGAIPLSIGQTCSDTFDNTLAVDEGVIAPAACFDRFTTVNDVWYSFVAPENGVVCIQTDCCEGTLDTFQVAVYSGADCSSLLEVACKMSYEDCDYLYLTPSETHYVRVNGISEEGTFCLQIDELNCEELPVPMIELSDVQLFSFSYALNLAVINFQEFPDSIFTSSSGLSNYCTTRMEAQVLNAIDSSILETYCLFDSSSLQTVSFSVDQDSCPPTSILLKITDNLCGIDYYSLPLSISCNADSDSAAIYEDCNDFDATIYPGAVEICDGLDNNCDGNIDEGIDLVTITCYQDADKDGYFRTWGTSHFVCPDQTCPDLGMSATVGDDCNDNNENINPGATEVCDGNDNNCNGEYDEGTIFKVLVCYEDYDEDGYYNSYGQTFNVCDTTLTCIDVLVNSVDTEGTDCNDFDAAVFPGAGCCIIENVSVTFSPCDSNNLFSATIELYHDSVNLTALAGVDIYSQEQSGGGNYYARKTVDSDTMTTIVVENIVADGRVYNLYTYVEDGSLFCNKSQNFQALAPCVTPPANDSCQYATIISDINSCQTILASTAGALSEVSSYYCSSAADVWYQFTAESAGVKVTATDLESYGTNNMIFEVYGDSCAEFSQPINYCRYLQNNSSTSINGLIPGEDYKLRVWFEGGAKGEFCLEATCGLEITEALTITSCNTNDNTFDLTLDVILADGILGDSLVISAGNIRQKFAITTINDTVSYTVTGINATGSFINVSLITEGVRVCENFLYGLFTAPLPCVAPLVNDSCNNAIIIDNLSNCTPISVSVVGATEDNNNYGCSNLGADIWYQFTAPSENINLTAIDIVMQGQSSLIYELYDTCVGASPISYCNYLCEGCENTISGLTIGQDYYLRIALSEAVSASFCIQGGTVINNDDVCQALPINLDEFYSGSFTNATTQANEPYALGDDCNLNWCDTTLFGSVWYQFIAPLDSAVQIETYRHTDTTYSDTKIALYEGIDCHLSNPFQNAVLLDANDDKPGNCCDGSIISLACLNPGQTYYIQVDQYSANQDDFNLIVRTLEDCSLSCDLIAEEVLVSADSCNGDGGSKIVPISTASGQVFDLEVYDTLGNFLFLAHSNYLFGMNVGYYRIFARSLEVANCEIDFGIIEVPAAIEIECPIASAGSDQLDICGANTTLGATGTGFWSVNNSDEVEEFSDVHDPTATFSGTFGYSYELVWTVVAPCCEHDSDIVIIQFNGDDDNNGVQNCNESGDCPPTLAVNDAIIHPGTYQAGEAITSTGGVAANDNVTFKAGQAITLLPGFHANQGATFHAFIDDCSIAAAQEPEVIAPTAKYIGTEVEVLKQPLTLTIQPNPFWQETSIVYELEESKQVDLRIFDMNGKLIRTVVSNQLQESGIYQYDFRPTDTGANIYFAILVTEDTVISKKMIFIR